MEVLTPSFHYPFAHFPAIMAPSFPGMNPYLEHPSLWAEVHSWLIVQLARFLNPSLIPKYRAAVEKRVYRILVSRLISVPKLNSTRLMCGSRFPNSCFLITAKVFVPKLGWLYLEQSRKYLSLVAALIQFA